MQRGCMAAAIAAIGLVAAILGLVPPILDLLKDDEPAGATATTTTAAAVGPAPATTPAAPPRPPGTVAAHFVGTWVGSVEQGTSAQSPYPVRLTITGGTLGRRVGGTEYPTLSCGGHLVLSAESDTELVVQEQLTTGAGDCVDDTRIVLSPNADGSLNYHIQAAGFFTPEADGTLHRQD
jgi:hypothetical protein